MADEEKAEEKSDDVEEKPKGSKKLLIIGLVLGLVVGGGGAAGFFIMQAGSNAEAPVEPVVVEEKKPELPDYQYARMDKLKLPVVHNGRILNYTVMDVSMEVIGNDDKMLAVRNVLIVRDSLLRHYSVNSLGRDDNPRIVDYDKLSDKIIEFANAEAHKDIVKRVVISESRSF